MSNYKSAIKRINHATGVDDLERVERGLKNVHAIGHLTDSELMRLDIKMCDRIDQLLEELTA
jgi:hypothetical protein